MTALLSPSDAQLLLAQASLADTQGALQPEAIALIHRNGWLKMLAPAS